MPGLLLRRPRVSRRTGVLVAIVFLAAVAALMSDASRSASQSINLGDENSWIRVQNVGNSPADIQVDYYDMAGKRISGQTCPDTGVCTALQPGRGWTFFQQDNTTLPSGYRGSGHITVDQPFVALMARDVLRTDGTFEISGDSLRLGAPTPEQYAPLVVNTNDYVSRLTIENTSADKPACVQIRYYPVGKMAPAVVDPPAPTRGCSQGGTLLAPHASLLRDENSLPVPLGFDGAALVKTFPTDSGVAAADQEPSLMVDTRVRTGPGIGTYRGINSDEVNRVVVLPMVDRNGTEGQSTWTTRFRIFNGDPTTPNEVTLRFEGTDGQGNQVEIDNTVTVDGSLTCDQSQNGVAGCLPAGKSLPSTFIGHVRMQAVQPVAVVVERISPGGAFSTYRGFSASEASKQVVLPVVDKNYGPFGAKKGWNSWFRVLTFDGSTAHVHVVYYSKEFPTGLIGDPQIVPGQATFRQWDDHRLPNDWVGSVVIVSDRPVVVLANLESDVFKGDPAMMYNGISLD